MPDTPTTHSDGASHFDTLVAFAAPRESLLARNTKMQEVIKAHRWVLLPFLGVVGRELSPSYLNWLGINALLQHGACYERCLTRRRTRGR
jgi:hypothetical protein